MCKDCWIEAGKPVPTAKSIAAVPLIEAVYDHHPAGGRLHIVLDDWNLSDSNISFCVDLINKNEWAETYEYPRKAAQDELACAHALMGMTQQERASALAIWRGYTPLPQDWPGKDR